MGGYCYSAIVNNRLLYVECDIVLVMYIYEVVYKSSDGAVDHQVVTESSEEQVKDNWSEHREGNDEIIDIQEHGRFRTNDSFQEVKADILDRGVPEKYQ